MDWQSEKCVMVIDESLPLGIIANTAAIMGITLGKKMPEVVGADVTDQSGNEHLGIIEFPVPILRGSPEIIKQIREKLYQSDFQDLTVVDFSDLAQGCKTYDSVAQQDLEKIDTMLRLNVEALTILSSLFVRDYKDVPGTQLINLSSCGGYTIVPTAVTYCATKFYVSTFTEGLAWELIESGARMRAKVLAPAATQTEFGKKANNVDTYDYDKAFGTYHTSRQMAEFLMKLYDSDSTLGIVDRETFQFELRLPMFPYANSSTHNQHPSK